MNIPAKEWERGREGGRPDEDDRDFEKALEARSFVSMDGDQDEEPKLLLALCEARSGHSRFIESRNQVG
jgi:hypothetical protein